jgi:methyl-accepting chemotaxis protein
MSSRLSYIHTLWATTWTENSLPGKIIVSLIVVLLIRSWIYGRRHIRRYHRENANLSKVSFLLAKLRAAPSEEVVGPEGAQSRPRSQHPAPIPVDRLKEGVDPSTLIFDRISAIEKLRMHRVKVNVAALQQMSLAKDASQTGMSIPAFNAQMAMSLGLLGTFLGLALMAQQIQFALPGGASEALDSWSRTADDISSVLFGIKTAFSTSLAGMACAMISSILSFQVRQAHHSFFERLERFTTEDLLPAAVPVVEDETLLEEMTRQLRESFNEIQTVSQQNREALQDMAAAETAFAEIVEEIREITKSEASRDLESVISQLIATNRAVLQLVEQMPAMARTFERRSERLLEKFSEPRFQASPGNRGLLSAPSIVGLITVVLVLFFWLLKSMAS